MHERSQKAVDRGHAGSSSVLLEGEKTPSIPVVFHGDESQSSDVRCQSSTETKVPELGDVSTVYACSICRMNFTSRCSLCLHSEQLHATETTNSIMRYANNNIDDRCITSDDVRTQDTNASDSLYQNRKLHSSNSQENKPKVEDNDEEMEKETSLNSVLSEETSNFQTLDDNDVTIEYVLCSEGSDELSENSKMSIFENDSEGKSVCFFTRSHFPHAEPENTTDEEPVGKNSNLGITVKNGHIRDPRVSNNSMHHSLSEEENYENEFEQSNPPISNELFDSSAYTRLADVYVCNYCSASFTRACQIFKHIALHKGGSTPKSAGKKSIKEKKKLTIHSSTKTNSRSSDKCSSVNSELQAVRKSLRIKADRSLIRSIQNPNSHTFSGSIVEKHRIAFSRPNRGRKRKLNNSSFVLSCLEPSLVDEKEIAEETNCNHLEPCLNNFPGKKTSDEFSCSTCKTYSETIDLLQTHLMTAHNIYFKETVCVKVPAEYRTVGGIATDAIDDDVDALLKNMLSEVECVDVATASSEAAKASNDHQASNQSKQDNKADGLSADRSNSSPAHYRIPKMQRPPKSLLGRRFSCNSCGLSFPLCSHLINHVVSSQCTRRLEETPKTTRKSRRK